MPSKNQNLSTSSSLLTTESAKSPDQKNRIPTSSTISSAIADTDTKNQPTTTKSSNASTKKSSK